MKIRTKLTIRYAGATAFVFILFMLTIYISTNRSRSREFYRDLKREAITKAHLFLDKKVDAETMQSIYLSNREFIDEVEVAVYDTAFHLLYHDAQQIDIVKETPQMIEDILLNKNIEFYQEDYQVVGLLYNYEGTNYIVTAAAFDGYGYAKQESLRWLLILLTVVGLVLLASLGYILAKSALSPVSLLVQKVDKMTASDLNQRFLIQNKEDELGELTQTFNKMLDRIEQSFNAQKMFVSNVSHELRTPMAALKAELEISLLKGRSTEEYKMAIENALIDAKKVIRLIEDLLDLAKTDYLKEGVQKEKIRLDELLLDVRESILKVSPDYFVELSFVDIPTDEALISVLGNRYLLCTAFMNLMENNCKYSQDKTSYIRISYKDDLAIIYFSDRGVGMTPKDIENVFLPFYRGENTNHIDGNGIGMTLTQRIITLHQGRISIASVLKQGTTFIIKIPHLGATMTG